MGARSSRKAQARMSSYSPGYQRAIELIGRRWTGAIVRSLLGGSARFSEIAEAIPGLSDRLLSERLKELEAEGVVERLRYARGHVEYRLTAKGRALAPTVRAMSVWAEEWQERGSKSA